MPTAIPSNCVALDCPSPQHAEEESAEQGAVGEGRNRKRDDDDRRALFACTAAPPTRSTTPQNSVKSLPILQRRGSSALRSESGR